MNENDILGSINAESDHLLLECAIENYSAFENKHILTGRWGVGKSAILILKNKKVVKILEDTVGEIDKQKLRLCWYAGEDTLDYDILRLIEEAYSGKKSDYLISAYEKLWLLEILRTYCVTLGNLNKYYFFYTKSHWNEIQWLADNSKFRFNNVWKNVSLISQVLGLTLSHMDKKENAMSKSIETDDKHLLSLITKCLADLKEANEEFIPIIAIEPIETHNSKIENDNSLAQNLIEALLNVFATKFYPSEYSNFNVRLSIPWHRLSNADAKFMHKLLDNIGIVQWSKKRLKEFINRRISYAYKKAGISHKYDKTHEAWYFLFERHLPYTPISSLPNIVTNEDSFEYFLRHSHYRPRDLLQLVKFCIAAQIEETEEFSSEKDVFISGQKISAKLIKDTFRDKGDKVGEIIIKEGKRKYRQLEILTNLLGSIKIPISETELRKILGSQTKIQFDIAIQILWDCGILGISVNTNNDYIKRILEAKYTTNLHRVYIEAKQTRWYWFQHLCKEEHINLISNYLNDIKDEVPSFEWNFIIHPKMYEYLNIRPSDTVPLGI